MPSWGAHVGRRVKFWEFATFHCFTVFEEYKLQIYRSCGHTSPFLTRNGLAFLKGKGSLGAYR